MRSINWECDRCNIQQTEPWPIGNLVSLPDGWREIHLPAPIAIRDTLLCRDCVTALGKFMRATSIGEA